MARKNRKGCQVNLIVEPPILERLRAAAEREGMTLSAWLRETAIRRARRSEGRAA